MAMYWPDQKVALDIIDDPLAEHVDLAMLDSWDVLFTTVGEISSLEGMRRVGDALCLLLGQEPPEKTPEWLEANERLFNELNEVIPGLHDYPYCVSEE